MILIGLIIILLLGGLLAWLLGRWNTLWSRWAALLALLINLGAVLSLWTRYPVFLPFSGETSWLVEFNR